MVLKNSAPWLPLCCMPSYIYFHLLSSAVGNGEKHMPSITKSHCGTDNIPLFKTSVGIFEIWNPILPVFIIIFFSYKIVGILMYYIFKIIGFIIYYYCNIINIVYVYAVCMSIYIPTSTKIRHH